MSTSRHMGLSRTVMVVSRDLMEAEIMFLYEKIILVIYLSIKMSFWTPPIDLGSIVSDMSPIGLRPLISNLDRYYF